MRCISGCSTSVTGCACIARSASVSLLKYAHAFIATARTIDPIRIDLFWNSAPMNTISADIPTSNANVFTPL
jgi:hypothetical protein